MKNTKRVCVSLSEKQFEILQQLAEESFRTRSGYIRKLMIAYFEYIKTHPESKIM